MPRVACERLGAMGSVCSSVLSSAFRWPHELTQLKIKFFLFALVAKTRGIPGARVGLLFESFSLEGRAVPSVLSWGTQPPTMESPCGREEAEWRGHWSFSGPQPHLGQTACQKVPGMGLVLCLLACLVSGELKHCCPFGLSLPLRK